jgi:two-component system KDP operon response regulator KdpE
MKALILIVEDDAQIRRFLRATLTAEGYSYQEALTAGEGIQQANAKRPDLILLDLGLPDRDGLDVIRIVREWSQMPIVVLSARGQENDKIAALDPGADDYVAKPFGVGELLARIRAALRRSATAPPEGAVLRFGRVEVDLDKRLVRVGGEDVHLTPNEYRLLQLLLKYPGKVLTQRQLLNEVWGPNHLEQAQYLRVYIAQLRRKLESDPGAGDRLPTGDRVNLRAARGVTAARQA